MRITILVFSIIICSCAPKNRPTGNIYRDPTKSNGLHAYYLDDSLDFSISYFGFPNNIVAPDSRDTRKDMGSKKFKKLSALNNKGYLAKFSHGAGTSRRYLLIKFENTERSGINGSINQRYQFLKNKKLVSDIDSTFHIDTLKYINRGISYNFKEKNKFYNVIEVHLPAGESGQIIRFIFIMDRLTKKDYGANILNFIMEDVTQVMTTYRAGQIQNLKIKYEQDPSNLFPQFRLSGYNYLQPNYWIHRFAQQDTSISRKENAATTELTFNSFMGNFDRNTKSIPDTIIFAKKFTPQNAVDLIREESKKHQVIMLNEDHLDPYCRYFAHSLLKDLYENGYRILAVETLAHYPDLNSKNYILQDMGFYSAEPTFGAMLREARRLGFQLVSYQNETSCDCNDRICRFNCREKGQASQLTQLLKANPDAKIFVYAGHAHIRKKNPGSKIKFMAEYFIDSTGINPFCIEQSYWISNQNQNELSSLISTGNSVALYDAQDKTYWTTPVRSKQVDMEIIHPPTIYQDGYPTFLTQKGSHSVPIKLFGSEYEGTLFQVFEYTEYMESGNKSIPLINLRLNSKNNFHITLPNGKFLIKVLNRFNNTIYNETLDLKSP